MFQTNQLHVWNCSFKRLPLHGHLWKAFHNPIRWHCTAQLVEVSRYYTDAQGKSHSNTTVVTIDLPLFTTAWCIRDCRIRDCKINYFFWEGWAVMFARNDAKMKTRELVGMSSRMQNCEYLGRLKRFWYFVPKIPSIKVARPLYKKSASSISWSTVCWLVYLSIRRATSRVAFVWYRTLYKRITEHKKFS